MNVLSVFDEAASDKTKHNTIIAYAMIIHIYPLNPE